MSFIPPVPSSQTKDPLLRQFLETIRNAVNGRINVSGFTSDRRDEITSWIEGDVIFNSTTSKLNRFDGSTWQEL